VRRMIKPHSPSLVLLDLDGTLTPVKSPWRYVYERLGTWDSHGVPILTRYQSGEIDYATFCRLDTEAWQNAGANLSTVLEILDEIPFPAQSLAFVQTLVEREFLITIVSTGFDRVATNLSERVGLPFSRRLRPVINGIRTNGDRLEAVLRVHEGDTRRGKGSWARRLVRFSSIAFERTFALGDGASDTLMFAHVGRGFSVRGPQDLPKILDQIMH
jgi:HAD superfamily phosphoserine phosphatase-like hydrolase